MGMFIKLEIDSRRCVGSKQCDRCIDVCPVDIFCLDKGLVNINADNEDECILCKLCIENCAPRAIRIKKSYED